MGSLKDALLKAGLKETPKPKVENVKAHNERKAIPKKKETESMAHQKQRNFCEECRQIHPDVEQYFHKNPTTDAEWICIRCADRLQILDNTRQTAQSDTSIRKMFRREYGATKKF
ncbi:MAG: hypothetical protein U0T83_08165 [Bacteriovoracaceae bacterium]